MGLLKSLRKKAIGRKRKSELKNHFRAQGLNGVVTPSRAAFKVTGGIGDHILAARFVRDLFQKTGSFPFDVYSSKIDTAKWLFSAFPDCKGVFSEQFLWQASHREYPIALYLTQFVCVMLETFDARFVSRWQPKLVPIAENLHKSSGKISLHMRHHPLLDGELGRLAALQGFRRHTYMQSLAHISFGGNQFVLPANHDVIDRLGLKGKQYITVHNGYDAEFAGQNTTATKVYPHFKDIIARIKKDFTDIYVVQVGSTTSRPIAEVHENAINKTSLSELVALLEGSALHLDSESGLVHMASCTGTRSVVVFGPTDINYYGYEDNINIAPTVCGNCWWAVPYWNTQCVRGDANPACMYTQSASHIYEIVKTELNKCIGSMEKENLRIVRTINA